MLKLMIQASSKRWAASTILVPAPSVMKAVSTWQCNTQDIKNRQVLFNTLFASVKVGGTSL